MVLADIQTKYGLNHMSIVLFLHLTHIYLFSSLQPQPRLPPPPAPYDLFDF